MVKLNALSEGQGVGGRGARLRHRAPCSHAPMPRFRYPIFLDLQGRRCVVAGGGAVAERKVGRLVSAGAAVRVISPALTARLRRWARAGAIRHTARAFRAADVRGAWLVIAATDDARVNRLASRAAAASRMFVNVVDQPRLCSFAVPAVVRAGDLRVAISTGGASPLLARTLRRDWSRTLGADYARVARLLKRVRPSAQHRLSSAAERKRFFAAVLNGRAGTLARQGQAAEAVRLANGLLTRMAAGGAA